MRLDITGRHLDITPVLRQLIDKRLARLGRLLEDSAISAQVILTKDKYRLRTEINVHARGDRTMGGHGEATTWPASVKQASEKIEQQVAWASELLGISPRVMNYKIKILNIEIPRSRRMLVETTA